MIHLHLSKIFNDDLAKAGCAIPPAEGGDDGWHWHAHRITLMRKKCVIVMEEECRYALVFVGMKKLDFAGFDEVLASRIVAEASWLCDLPHPGPNDRLIAAVAQKCGSVVFSRGLDRSVQAHISRAAEDMEFIVRDRLGRLPESAKEEFALGLKVNKFPRKCKGDKEYFVPAEKWRDSLKALLPREAASNVVSLDDFRKGWRR